MENKGIEKDHLVTGGTAQGEDHIAIYRGYLNVRDTKGAYKIYIGKESRRKLLTLYEKPGVVTRSLEIDLNTGTVYYDVAAANTGSAAYFYDTANRKVDNFEISQFLKYVRPPFRPSDLEMEVFSQFPSENWLDDLRRIPGWDRIIDDYLDSLRLPKEEVESKEIGSAELLNPDREAIGGYIWGEMTGVMITLRSKISRRGWHSHFTIGRREDGTITLHHRNDNMGAEFFHEDEEFERCLSPVQYAWILHIVKTLVAGEKLSENEDNGRKAANMDSVRLEFGDRQFTWRPRTMAHARRMEEMLMKFLRRELEISTPSGEQLLMLDNGDVNEKIRIYEELEDVGMKSGVEKSGTEEPRTEKAQMEKSGVKEPGTGESGTGKTGINEYGGPGAVSAAVGRGAALKEGASPETGKRRKVQALVDNLHMNEALDLLIRYQKQIDVIEIGPVYLLRYGPRGIAKMKEQFPYKTLICDTNIVRPGGQEAELAFEAGADIVTVMAVAPDQVKEDCVGVAGKYNRRIMADMLGVSDPELETDRLRMIGVEVIGALPDTGIVETREGMAADIVKVMGLAK